MSQARLMLPVLLAMSPERTPFSPRVVYLDGRQREDRIADDAAPVTVLSAGDDPLSMFPSEASTSNRSASGIGAAVASPAEKEAPDTDSMRARRERSDLLIGQLEARLEKAAVKLDQMTRVTTRLERDVMRLQDGLRTAGASTGPHSSGNVGREEDSRIGHSLRGFTSTTVRMTVASLLAALAIVSLIHQRTDLAAAINALVAPAVSPARSAAP